MRMHSVSQLCPACDLLAVNRMASYDDMHEVCLLGTPDRSKRFTKDAGLLLLKHSHLNSPLSCDSTTQCRCLSTGLVLQLL